MDSELVREAEEWSYTACVKAPAATHDLIVQLTIALRAAERDAGRYRWMRKSVSFENDGTRALTHPDSGERLDDAIDSALQQERGRG